MNNSRLNWSSFVSTTIPVMNKSDAGMFWFVLHCKGGQETRARQHVENQGYRTSLPQISRQKIVRGKKTDCIEPLFPGYLFVQLDTNTANFNALRSTRGVNGFVRFGGMPATVPAAVMDSIMVLEQAFTAQPDAEPMFKSGDKVQITEGPFAGLEAIYSMAKGEDRCLVFLDMLGKQQRITLAETALRPSL